MLRALRGFGLALALGLSSKNALAQTHALDERRSSRYYDLHLSLTLGGFASLGVEERAGEL